MHLCLQQLIYHGEWELDQPREVSNISCTPKPCQEQRDVSVSFVRDTKHRWVQFEDAFYGVGAAPLHPTADLCTPTHPPRAAWGAQGEENSWCKVPIQQGVQPHGQHGRLALLQTRLFPHPSVPGGCEMEQSQGAFQRHFSNPPPARTTGQRSAVLGCLSGQNFCLLLMLSFS